MSAALRPAPRRMGWTPLPVRCVRAPRCRGTVKDLEMQPYGAFRCSRCTTIMYVLAFLPLRLAFVAETTAGEMLHLDLSTTTAADVLAYFGAAFPYLET